MISNVGVAALFFLAFSLAPMASALFGAHSQSTSQYIHSNDTISLQLDPRAQNQLNGPSGSMVSLQFILINRGLQGHFTIT